MRYLAAGHGYKPIGEKDKENKAQEVEMYMFNGFIWGHSLLFVFYNLFWLLKTKGYFFTAQLIQALSPIVYINTTLFAVWYIKKHALDHWLDEINQVQAWIIIEITYFGCWICAGVMYLLWA